MTNRNETNTYKKTKITQ